MTTSQTTTKPVRNPPRELRNSVERAQSTSIHDFRWTRKHRDGAEKRQSANRTATYKARRRRRKARQEREKVSRLANR